MNVPILGLVENMSYIECPDCKKKMSVFGESHIDEIAKDKAVIFISHRLSTTKNADYIYMFDSGRIVEAGTHLQLMNLNGKYAEMFKLQAEKYQHRKSFHPTILHKKK